MSSRSSSTSIPAFDHSPLSSLPLLSLSRSSPTPSSSNSDLSTFSNPPKRKRTDGPDSSEPSKHVKASAPPTAQNSYQHLPFDPFNPHPGMSKEERKLARMIRNRTAAQASRDRKKEHVTELENRVKDLEAQLSQRHALICPHRCTDSATYFSSPPSPDIQTENSSHSVGPIDPSIITDDPSHLPNPPTTLSPTQSEYLSTIRIHLLEEENAQLKAQLELEVKRSAEIKSGLLRNHLSTPVPTNWTSSPTEPLGLDCDLFDLILKEEEVEQMLSPDPGSATTLLDPALTGGEALSVTPSLLRFPHSSGPAPTDRRLAAREEVLSLQRIGRKGSCVFRSGWRWTLMWCWVAWEARRNGIRLATRTKLTLLASLICLMMILLSLRVPESFQRRKTSLASLGSLPFLSPISFCPDLNNLTGHIPRKKIFTFFSINFVPLIDPWCARLPLGMRLYN